MTQEKLKGRTILGSAYRRPLTWMIPDTPPERQEEVLALWVRSGGEVKVLDLKAFSLQPDALK